MLLRSPLARVRPVPRQPTNGPPTTQIMRRTLCTLALSYQPTEISPRRWPRRPRLQTKSVGETSWPTFANTVFPPENTEAEKGSPKKTVPNPHCLSICTSRPKAPPLLPATTSLTHATDTESKCPNWRGTRPSLHGPILAPLHARRCQTSDCLCRNQTEVSTARPPLHPNRALMGTGQRERGCACLSCLLADKTKSRPFQRAAFVS